LVKIRKWKFKKKIVLAICIPLVVGALLAFLVVTKMGGDREVLDDIDRHFESFERYAPPPHAGSETTGESAFENQHPAPSLSPRSSSPSTKRAPRKEKQPKQKRSRGRKKRDEARLENRRTAQLAPAYKGIAAIGPGTYIVDSKLVAAAQQNPRKYVGRTHAQLAELDGKPVGFRLLRVGQGSPVHALGLRNGDVLTAVNGQELKTIDGALVAVTSLRFSDKFRLDILRRGTKRSLYYRVDKSDSNSK
jgi:C-terminal processing protease CtpA/Prc